MAVSGEPTGSCYSIGIVLYVLLDMVLLSAESMSLVSVLTLFNSQTHPLTVGSNMWHSGNVVMHATFEEHYFKVS